MAINTNSVTFEVTTLEIQKANNFYLIQFNYQTILHREKVYSNPKNNKTSHLLG